MALTQDDLLAISQLLDVKLKAEIQPIKNEIQSLKSDVQSVKTVMLAEMQALKAELQAEMQALKAELQAEMQALRAELQAEMQALWAELQAVKASLEAEIHKIKLFQENVIMLRLNTIESCYLSTYERYKDSTEGYEALQADNEIMKAIIMEHSERLQKLA